jgi:hypothetical protein
MTDLLERVFEKAQTLTEAQQNSLAELWLAELEDEQQWNQSFARPESQRWLESQAKEIRALIQIKRTKPFELMQNEFDQALNF